MRIIGMRESKIAKQSSIDNHDILSQIFQELPVKFLLRFKCVSKQWCSIIQSPQFVESHRIRSHTRLGGIKLLGHKLGVKEPSTEPVIYLLEPEANSELIHVQVPPIFYSRNLVKSRLSRHVEGLVCSGNFIWNPSTRKGIKLPDHQEGGPIPYFLGNGEYRIQNDYMLGFDAPSKRYKVLSICNISVLHSSEQQMLAKVLTLGTNLWRNLDCIPEQVKHGVTVYASCSINNLIFCLIQGPKLDTRNALMTFDVWNEKFRVIRLPDDLQKPYFAFEVSGQFATMEFKSNKTIWILKDYENEEWIKRNLNFPQDWFMSRFPNINPSAIIVSPIGTIHTQEILLQAGKRFNQLGIFHFYYNLETGRVRQIPIPFGATIKLSKHVETVFPFKQE